MTDREAMPSLFPREHGASIELLFALLTAYSLARPTLASIALGVAAILAFVAHEPFMVLVGRRGARRRELQGALARRVLVTLGLLASALGAYAALEAPWLALGAWLIPLALVAPAVALTLRGQERSLAAELLVAASLATIVAPIALTSGAPIGRVLPATMTWVVCFAIGTLAARGILYRAKDDGRGLSHAGIAATVALVLSILLAVLGTSSVLHALAPVPTALVALFVVARPPTPKQMARLGVGLTAASAVSFALVAA